MAFRELPGQLAAQFAGFVDTIEEDGERSDKEAQAAGDGNSAYPIWVKPWSQLNLPGFPGQRPSLGLLMVLHALLIHGGLWGRILPELLPLSPMEIFEYLHLLEAFGLVESDQGFWRVTPAGYPSVRLMLQSEGYLTDAILTFSYHQRQGGGNL